LVHLSCPHYVILLELSLADPTTVPLTPLSFPTRRSSDLDGKGVRGNADLAARFVLRANRLLNGRGQLGFVATNSLIEGATLEVRSEEHTSELQSRENLVCRLLLEKKKICLKNTNRKYSGR